MKKLIFLLICFYVMPAFAAIRARTDALNITEGQTFNLEIQTDGAQSKQPDLTALQKDFEILGQSQGQSSHFDGFTRKTQQSLTLTLQPKKTGILEIPSITWGNEKTKPLQIEVQAASDTAQIKNQSAVLIEGYPMATTTYQDAGIVYRAQIFERVGLIDGAFTAPKMANAQVIPLGSPTLSQAKKDDILYQTWTQDYIIFPEKNGDNLTIEPSSFQGYYRKTASSDSLLPFGFSDPFIYQPTLSARSEVLVRAKPTQITVLPKPAEAENRWWLPSTNVVLTEKWSGLDDEVQVGQPITRQVEMQAVNALGRMLPDLTVPTNDDFKIYPEQAQKREVYEPTLELVGIQTRTFAFIPLKAGNLTIPAITVQWFDTMDGQMKTARLPAKTVHIVPNPNQPTTIQSIPPNKEKSAARIEPAQQKPANPLTQENNLLYFMSGLCVGLLIGMIAIIILHRTYTQRKKLPELYPQ